MALAEAAGVSEASLYRQLPAKEELFEEVVQRNMQHRLAALQKRFSSIPDLPPLACIEQFAEATILACADEQGNASVMAWALMETPEFAADVYRGEIGATESMWHSEIWKRFPESPVRTRLGVRLVPYVVHACMAFGFWLATLRHNPATAAAHARQYAEGIAEAARVLVGSPAEPTASSSFGRLPEPALLG